MGYGEGVYQDTAGVQAALEELDGMIRKVDGLKQDVDHGLTQMMDIYEGAGPAGMQDTFKSMQGDLDELRVELVKLHDKANDHTQHFDAMDKRHGDEIRI